MPYSNPYFLPTDAGSPGSAGAAGFMGGFLEAMKATHGVGAENERLRLAAQKLAEEKRQADLLQLFRQAEMAKLAAETSGSLQAQQNLRAYQQEMGDLYNRPPNVTYQPGVDVSQQEYPGGAPIQTPVLDKVTRPGYTPQEAAAILMKYRPEAAVQAMQAPGQIAHTAAQTQYMAGPQTAHTEAQTGFITGPQTRLSEAQAALDYMKGLALMRKEPNPDKLTGDLKNFLGVRFPQIFTDHKAMASALAYLDTPQGKADWQQYYSWVKTSETPTVTGQGVVNVPTKPGMPGVPGAAGGGQPPQAARAVNAPGGGPLLKPMTPMEQDAFTALMEINDSFNTAKSAIAANPNATGPTASLWNAAATRIPGLSVSNSFQQVSQPLNMLYDIVYGKSGKQINENELKIIKGYTPQPEDKPEVIAVKMQNFERHLYSLIYNRAMNAQGSGIALPPEVQAMAGQAQRYFETTKSRPVPGFGMAPVGGGEKGTKETSATPPQSSIPTWNPNKKKWE